MACRVLVAEVPAPGTEVVDDGLDCPCVGTVLPVIAGFCPRISPMPAELEPIGNFVAHAVRLRRVCLVERWLLRICGESVMLWKVVSELEVMDRSEDQICGDGVGQFIDIFPALFLFPCLCS